MAIRHAIAYALLDEGYRVVMAANMREALGRPPDVVDAADMMPPLTGTALPAELRQRGPRVPVLLMSAHAKKAGAAGLQFLAKPFELEHLLKVVAPALALD